MTRSIPGRGSRHINGVDVLPVPISRIVFSSETLGSLHYQCHHVRVSFTRVASTCLGSLTSFETETPKVDIGTKLVHLVTYTKKNDKLVLDLSRPSRIYDSGPSAIGLGLCLVSREVPLTLPTRSLNCPET